MKDRSARLIDQSQNTEFFRNVKRRDAGGLPGYLFLVWVTPRDAEKPYPQFTARGGQRTADRLEWNLHFPVPDLPRRVNAGLHLHSGVPFLAAPAPLTCAVDI